MIQPIQAIEPDEDAIIVQIEKFVGRLMMDMPNFNVVYYFGTVRVDGLQIVFRDQKAQPKTLEADRDKNILIIRMIGGIITGIGGFADYAQL
jgi:hypothetical protein